MNEEDRQTFIANMGESEITEFGVIWGDVAKPVERLQLPCVKFRLFLGVTDSSPQFLSLDTWYIFGDLNYAMLTLRPGMCVAVQGKRTGYLTLDAEGIQTSVRYRNAATRISILSPTSPMPIQRYFRRINEIDRIAFGEKQDK